MGTFAFARNVNNGGTEVVSASGITVTNSGITFSNSGVYDVCVDGALKINNLDVKDQRILFKVTDGQTIPIALFYNQGSPESYWLSIMRIA